ncbi:MAG: hypothetical protein ABIH08_04975, partial [Candidatus Omnitrophota bacterium]
ENVFLSETTSLNSFAYLKNRLEPVSPSSFFLSFFVDNIGANSVYYDLLAKIIKIHYSKNSEEDSIVYAMEEALYFQQTYLFQKFIKEIELIKFNFKDFTSIIKLLFSLSEGYLRKRELVSLGIYNSKDLNNRLIKLLDLNYINNLGDIYKLKDSLFSFWLSHAFKLHFSSAFGLKEKQVLYRKKIKESIAIFKEGFFEDKPKKILQLFSSFKNDNLKLGKNKYNLPSIEKIKMIAYPQDGLNLIVGEGKEIIFAGVKENNTEDNDIFKFIDRGANIKGKKIKKIFISLGSLSPEAKLIAKNNKLLIWDTNEVNRLLNVYNKPFVS